MDGLLPNTCSGRSRKDLWGGGWLLSNYYRAALQLLWGCSPTGGGRMRKAWQVVDSCSHLVTSHGFAACPLLPRRPESPFMQQTIKLIKTIQIAILTMSKNFGTTWISTFHIPKASGLGDQTRASSIANNSNMIHPSWSTITPTPPPPIYGNPLSHPSANQL